MATTESAKEGFRKYLESAGAIDVLVKVLVSLYEEADKPAKALDYIKATLGGPTPVEYESVCAQRDSYKEQVEKLQAELEKLQASASRAP